MKISNRILGFLILTFFILAFFIFYNIFFKIKLTNLEINSNVAGFSGIIENLKFNKEFFCKEKKCIINEIPPFKYSLNITKSGFIDYKTNIDLGQKNIVNINLDKKLYFNKLGNEKISREDLLDKIKNKKEILYLGKKQKYEKIFNEKKYVYFQIKDKVVFYNLFNNNNFSIDFIPKIEYIKKINDRLFIIKTDVGSFNFDLLSKIMDYFSLFSDYVLYENNYIGVLNSDDKQRKINMGFQDRIDNLIVLYDLGTKNKKLIKSFSDKIEKIYLENSNIIIEKSDKSKYKLEGL